MRLARPSIWIPGVLAALALNVLIFVPRASELMQRPRVAATDQPDFWLQSPKRGDWPIRTPGAPSTAEQLEARSRPDEEAAHSPAGWSWSGAYTRPGGIGWGGQCLRLGTRSYTCIRDADLTEFGTFSVEGELLRLHPVAKREASGLSSEYIRVQSGNATCLATAEEVPAFFYPAERIDSPFRRVLDSVFVLDGLRIEPGFWPAIPEAYRAERERRARVRLVERLPAAQSGGASLARFEQVSGAPLEPLDRLWWEGETCTFVRASVREIGPKGVLAALDLPRGMSEETLEIGTTFSRLPRLE